MPRISDESRARRRAVILDAAREQFARNGFQATSMDDIVTAAGMSTGGVYRHFTGKDEIIAAIAADVGDRIAVAVSTLVADAGDAGDEVAGGTGALADDLRRLLRLVAADADSLGRMAVTVMGEAQRDPTVAAIAAEQQRRLRRVVTDAVVRSGVRDGPFGRVRDVDAAGQVMFSIVVGFLLQATIVADVDADRYADAACLLLGMPGPADASTGAGPRDG